MKNLREAEDIDFAFTSSSLNKAYQMSYNHALQMVERNGGCVGDSTVTIVCQKPVPVRLEKAFEGMYPIMRKNLNRMVEKFGKFEFEGTGFVMRGSVKSKNDDYVAHVSVYVMVSWWKKLSCLLISPSDVRNFAGNINCLKVSMSLF